MRTVSLVALAVGAVSSVSLVLLAGRHIGSPAVVVVLVALWVLAPFAALTVAAAIAKRWPAPAQRTLYGTTIVLALASLAVYAYAAYGAPRARPAPIFVATPAVTWLLGLAVAAATLRRSRRRLPGFDHATDPVPSSY